MRVLHVQYTNPGAYPPLVRGAQLLAESGADVLMLGTQVAALDALSVTGTPGISVRPPSIVTTSSAPLTSRSTHRSPDAIRSSPVTAATLGARKSRAAHLR